MSKLKLTRFHPSKPPGTTAVFATTSSFNAAINSLSSQHHHRDVIITFNSMLESPTAAPDAFTYPSLLKACSSLGFVSLGLSLHQQIVVNGLSCDSYISSSLINFYAKLRDTTYAREVFDGMPHRNIVPWTAIIWCYSNAGDMRNAFYMYNSMQCEGIVPSSVTVLNMLTGVSESQHVGILHASVIKFGYMSNVILTNCLLSVYAKCGRVGNARELFELLDERDIVSWNSLIKAYSVLGDLTEVLQLFLRMRTENVEPDQQTFGSLVSAIAREGDDRVGRVLHALIITSGFESEKHVGTSLVSFYSRCRKVDEALRVFERASDKDVVFWTSMISGLVQGQSADKALTLLHKMMVSGVTQSAATMACALAACAQLGSVKLGKSIHCYMLRQQMVLDISVQNALVSLYAKCGLLEQSHTVFSLMAERDVVSWNAIVAGYAQNGYLSQSLHLFLEMRLAQQQPDSVTIICLLQACASIGAYHQGKWIHNYVIRSCLGPCIKISTSLVDMYAKCGDLDSARKCFDRMPHQDDLMWSAMIAGYGSNGKGQAALAMYSEYLQNGFTPNDVILLSVLYACSHNGLVDSGIALFESMKNDKKIEPKIEHCACIVDLLCRAGRVHDGYDFYRKTFAEPMVDVLGILLDACRSPDQEELGCIIAKQISEIKPKDGGKYVQLAHSFASMTRWDGVGGAWAQMRALGLRKLPGWSFIEMHGKIIPFYTRDTSHPDHASIVSGLRNLTEETKISRLISTHDEFSLKYDVL